VTPSIVTKPFRLGRLQIARAASLLYIGKAWWLIITFPLFGVWMLMTSHEPALQYVGLVSILWPFSIPARGIIVTRKSARILMGETVAILEDDALYIKGPQGAGSKVGLDRITKVHRSLGLFVIEVKHYVFVLVPIDAFASDAEAGAFEQRIRKAISV
jgi:hypothetical protein